MAMVEQALDPLENVNISAYRVLFLLLMLVRFRSLNAAELNRHLSENPGVGRAYNSETLTKYINTLREVGCEIPRSTSRNDYSYDLKKTPFPLRIDAVERHVAQKLLALLASQPDEALFSDFQGFLKQLSWYSDSACLADDNAVALLPLPALSRRAQQMREYRSYCQAAFTLDITYHADGQELRMQMEPHAVVTREQRLLLLGLDCQSQQSKSLDVDQITEVRQLPSKNRRPSSYTNITFALYGRLSKGYRLYPDEKMVYQSDKEIHIKARVRETSGLMARLLKYGAQCQILQPESMRDTIRSHISGLLHNLENPTEIRPE